MVSRLEAWVRWFASKRATQYLCHRCVILTPYESLTTIPFLTLQPVIPNRLWIDSSSGLTGVANVGSTVDKSI
jgi:hypothetical protein